MHECRALGATAIRQIHYLLSGAYKRAVRWKWVGENPVSQVEPPASPPPSPKPPSPEEAARILNEAWREPDWGASLWLAMTSGVRRGELCALRWSDVDLAAGVVSVERAIAFDPERKVWFEKNTKQHQHRRITIDPVTTEILTEHRDRCQQRVDALGVELSAEAFVFSLAPDSSTFLVPSSVTQRYERMVGRLGIETTLHKLRHYSATELISAGVDVRTVAGRLGHGSGGITTLRVYSAWVSGADQRASTTLSDRVPERPPQLSASERAKTAPKKPYQKLAAAVRQRVLDGDLEPGDELPPMKAMAADHEVSVGTVQRAIALLQEWDIVEVRQGVHTTIRSVADDVSGDIDVSQPKPGAAPDESKPVETPVDVELLEVRRLGEPVRTFSAEADPAQPSQLRHLLAAAVRRNGRDASEILDYEMDVRRAADSQVLTTFVTINA